MVHLRPPKGYNMTEYPLPHNFDYLFSLQAEDETKNSTIVTLLRSIGESPIAADSIEVNPKHASFGEETGPSCQLDSIIPRMMVNFHIKLSKGAIETDKVKSLRVNWMPIYFAFADTFEAKDDKTDVEVEDILEMSHNTSLQFADPLYGGVDLDNTAATGDGSQPLSTKNYAETYGEYGLTTDAKLESVAFDEELFFDARQYYQNSGMLNKVCGRWHSVNLHTNWIYNHFSTNLTFPSVKRINPYTFCGILFHVPQVGSPNQYPLAGDTTAIPHVDIGMKIRYNEWNNHYDQTVS